MVQKIAAFAFIVLVIVVLTWIVTALLNNILKSLKLGPSESISRRCFWFIKRVVNCSDYDARCRVLGLKALHIGDNPNLSKHFCLTRLGRWSFLKRLQARRCHISSLKDTHVSSDSSPKISSKNAEGQGESTNNPFY